MKNNNILEEVVRVREIMGHTILNEYKDKNVGSSLNEGFIDKLFGGGDKRKNKILKILMAAQEDSGSFGNNIYYEKWAKSFAKFVNMLDRYAVNEKKVIEFIENGGLKFEQYEEFIKILVNSDYWKSGSKPKNLVDFLITTGKFKEGQKRQIDNALRDWSLADGSHGGIYGKYTTALSQITQNTEENREQHGDCVPEAGGTNTIDKKAYPAEWEWCQNKVDKFNKDNADLKQVKIDANTNGPRLLGTLFSDGVRRLSFLSDDFGDITIDTYLDNRLLSELKNVLAFHDNTFKEMTKNKESQGIYPDWSKAYSKLQKKVKRLTNWYTKAQKFIDMSPEDFEKEDVSYRYMFARNAGEREESGNSDEVFATISDKSWTKEAKLDDKEQQNINLAVKETQGDIKLNEINRIREIMGLNLLSEQKIDDVIVVDGERMKITDLIRTKLPGQPYDVGQKFKSGKYILSPDTKTDIKNAATQMATFFKTKGISNVMFNVVLDGGASKVPISDNLAKSYGISLSLSATDRNKWLAGRRAKSVQDELSKLLKAKGVTNVTFPEPTITVGGPDYADDDVNLDKYKEHQFMNITVKAGGKKMVLEALPKFCEEKMDAEQGKVGNPDWCYKVYPGDGKKLELGEGEGKICLSFDALSAPDMFDLTYNGKLYRSKNKQTGKEGFISTAFSPLSEDRLEEMLKKIPGLETEIGALQNTITKEKDALSATGPAQVEKLRLLLQEELKNNESNILDINRRVKKYGHLGLVTPKDKWYDLITHYRGFPNKLVPNEHWEDIRLGKKGKREDVTTKKFYKKPSEFYNLNEKGMIDTNWFIKFFESYPAEDGGMSKDAKRVRKSNSFKKLWSERKQDQDKKELVEFYQTMYLLQLKSEKLKDKRLKFLNKQMTLDKKSYINRIKNVESNIEEETKRLTLGLESNIKKANEDKQKVELTKAQKEMNLKVGGKGTYAYQEILEGILGECYKKKGQEVPPIVGNSATITFDKIAGVNEAWLQIHAPIGVTLWGLAVGCGEEACAGLEQTPYKYNS